MSVVAVRVNEKNIEVAADSIVVRGDTMRNDSGFKKLFKVNDMIIGAVGSAEECALFKYFCRVNLLEEPTEKCILEYMVNFLNFKINMTPNYPDLENAYIIIVGGKAFQVEGLLVQEIEEYAAIGAGEDFATAALYLGHTAEEAVKVSCALSCFVSDPIVKYVVEKE